MESFFAALKNQEQNCGFHVALKMVRKMVRKIKNFLKIPKIQKLGVPVWLHYGYIMATFDNVAKT